MRITDTEVIKSGEQELIDGITADLDWGAIEGIFREKHGLKIDEDVEYKRGDIVVHDGRVAYQLDFEVKVTIALLLDRDGNYLSVTSAGYSDEKRKENDVENPDALDILPLEVEKAKQTVPSATGPEESSNDETASSVPDETSPQEKISRMASRAGRIMESL